MGVVFTGTFLFPCQSSIQFVCLFVCFNKTFFLVFAFINCCIIAVISGHGGECQLRPPLNTCQQQLHRVLV